jgi:hypothetical protein
MTGENKKDSTITNEDLDALRILLHNVKGISAVSSSDLTTSQQDD